MSRTEREVDPGAADPPLPPVARGRRRRRRPPPRRVAARLRRHLAGLPLENAPAPLLALACGVAVLGLGGVHLPTMLAVAALATGALVCAALATGRDGRPFPIVGPGLVCWALAAWTVLQLVPLPMALLEQVAPTNADIWTRALLPFGTEPPRFAPISLDPGATWVEALRWYGYGATLIAAAALASQRGPTFGVTVVFGVALAASVITVVHGLLGLREVYGLYRPSFQVQPWHVGPLLNANNLAGLLNLGAFCGFGLLSTRRAPAPRWVLAILAAFVVGVAVTTASRSGVVSLALGLVLYLILAHAAGPRPYRAGLRGVPASWIVVATLCGGAIFAGLGMGKEGWTELLDENLSKLTLVGAAEAAVGDFFWVGMGRGAFESVYASYSPARGNVVMTHAENFVAQWVLEWGVIPAVLALLAFAFWLRPRKVGLRQSHLAVGVWVGAVVVLLQNMVDLGLEIPGLFIALCVALGSVWGRPERRREGTARLRTSSPFSFAIAASSAAAALGLGALVVGRHDVVSDRDRLRETLAAEPVPVSVDRAEALRARIHDATLRHPAEPYFPLAGAYLAWLRDEDNPIPWLQRALERSRHNGRAHLLLARVLRRHGHGPQALLELRLAIEDEPNLMHSAARLAHRWTQDPAELARMVPRGSEDAALVWAMLGETSPDRTMGAHCDERALALDPRLPGPRYRRAEDLVRAIQADEGDCAPAQRDCEAELSRHIEALREIDDGSALPDIVDARWSVLRGDAEGAEQRLAARCSEVADRMACLRARVEIAAGLTEEPERFEAATRALRAEACASIHRCAQVSEWIGDLSVERGDTAAAMSAYERALRDRESEPLLEKLARVAIRAGFSSKAIQALKRLLALRGSDPAVEVLLRAEEEKVMRSIMDRPKARPDEDPR